MQQSPGLLPEIVPQRGQTYTCSQISTGMSAVWANPQAGQVMMAVVLMGRRAILAIIHEAA
jgi:hypothetical protein